MRKHRLHPGYVYLADGTTTIWTIMGKGVVVCLWDRRSRRGGMAHFLRPTAHDPLRASPLYGDVALGMLISHLLVAGSRIEDMVARVYGGRSDDDNVAVARQVLAQYGIPLTSDGTGTEADGRLDFDVQTGEVDRTERRSVESGLVDLVVRQAVSAA